MGLLVPKVDMQVVIGTYLTPPSYFALLEKFLDLHIKKRRKKIRFIVDVTDAKIIQPPKY